MNKGLLSELTQLPSAERIELVYDLWESIPPGECPCLRADLAHLPPAERIELAMELWDSIPPEDIPLPTPEEMAEVERRLEEHRRHPTSAIPWGKVQAELSARYK